MLYQLGSSLNLSYEEAVRIWKVLIRSFVLSESASSTSVKTVVVNKLMD